MKRIILTLITIALISLPAAVIAGTSVSFGISSYGHGGGVSFGYSQHSPSYHHHRSRTVVIQGGSHYYNHRPVVRYRSYRPEVPRHYGHPNSYVHRQEGRVYEEEYYERRVYVVPSGRSRVIYHPY